MMRLVCAVFVSLICFVANVAVAAPNPSYPSPGSSAVTTADDLTLLEHRLDMSCSVASRQCSVHGHYLFVSNAPQRASFSFVTSLPSPITVHAYDSSSTSILPTLTPISPDDPLRDKLYNAEHSSDRPLYRVSFEVPIQPGQNNVSVSYEQPYSVFYQSFGLIGLGLEDPLREIGYDTWPLDAWRGSERAKMQVRVEILQQDPSLWTRLFGTYHHMTCGDLTSASSARATQSAQRLVFHHQFVGDRKPARFGCKIVEDDMDASW